MDFWERYEMHILGMFSEFFQHPNQSSELFSTDMQSARDEIEGDRKLKKAFST